MNILTELNDLLSGLDFAVETGVFSGEAPDEYVIVSPMSNVFPVFGDNLPILETQEARISLYAKRNYTKRFKLIVKSLLLEGFTITGQTYLGHEDDTSYFHVSIDVQKCYTFQLEGV